MEDLLNVYLEVRECEYKGEHYSVRDNGAIMRHPQEGKRLRPNDNKWTFGKQNAKHYMIFCEEQVHRIVATAFHGDPPLDTYVVDHIDTNHSNNRPENLRWVTKLENALLNDVTRKKVIAICGSVEAFLDNPHLLWDHVNEHPNFEWMRTVTKEEAQNTKARMEQWAKSDKKPTGKGTIGDWILQKADINESPLASYRFSMKQPKQNKQAPTYQPIIDEPQEPIRYPSLTPNAIQVKWTTPTSFVCCPSSSEEPSLEKYAKNLQKNEVFGRNQYGDSFVHEFELSLDKSKLWIITKSDNIKPWALARVEIEGDTYVHYSLGTFFHEDGAEKQFILAQGKVWTGGDTFDDFAN